MTFYDFVHDLFQFSWGFRYSCHLKKNFQNYPGFKVFWPNSDQQVTQVSDKMCAIFKKLFNYVFLSLFWSVHELI